MYFKRIMYNGYNIIVYCTPDITEEELLEIAKRRYDMYIQGKLSTKDLLGEGVDDKEYVIDTKEGCIKTIEKVIDYLLCSDNPKLKDIAIYDLQAVMSFIDKPEITKEQVLVFAKKTLLDFIEYDDHDGTYQYLKVSHIKMVQNHFRQKDHSKTCDELLRLKSIKEICEKAYKEAFKL